jgi:hypothetical protein
MAEWIEAAGPGQRSPARAPSGKGVVTLLKASLTDGGRTRYLSQRRLDFCGGQNFHSIVIDAPSWFKVFFEIEKVDRFELSC